MALALDLPACHSHTRQTNQIADLKYIELATRRIADVARGSKIIVEKSTVPYKTADAMRAILDANSKPGSHFDIISNPEFLAEGTAIEDLTNPDRVLIGSLETPSGRQAAEDLAAVYRNWVPDDKILITNLWSSEISKLAANALLAQRISSINALSSICEATGANVAEVARACGFDSRIGPKFLNASLGFGGSCFQKDILNLVYLSDSLHLPQVSSYWKQIVLLNEFQKQRFINRLIQGCLNTITGKRIAIWGFAFKKDTGDTRESPAITIVQGFLKEGANVIIYDPKVPETQIWSDLQEESFASPFDENPNPNPSCLNSLHLVTIAKSAGQAAFGADAVVICTEWDEFKPENCDYDLIYRNCRKPASLYDGRGIIQLPDEEKLIKMGWKVEVVGRAPRQKDSSSLNDSP
ncbi:UDP-glucose 6-dehydrogenase 4 [Neolecta irregularis DAH-3]|uniref:UDP-glucose 6-dehydrogenase n=1 Tax=Neolecta irregularis (strain DAH-3) TaxID=1198029 RepID=A0A1U7LWD8_NEOID|nr:UDP-glucose 6-dehydrogenase 4 [Neolecta irregularis DAH-3]|eukprot:OLL26821.1 UDP-glucose 6-dehydrogenase 4 [Neolecta irregularis DAH-3]